MYFMNVIRITAVIINGKYSAFAYSNHYLFYIETTKTKQTELKEGIMIGLRFLVASQPL